MRTKNRNTIYGFIGVILLISTTLPFYTLYNSNNIAVKNVTEDETEFNIMEYLLQNDFSENISEHAELIDAINVVISNQGENNNENDDNPKLKTSGLLSSTNVESPWWFELLCNNPLLGIAVIMVMGLVIGIREVVKALFAKAFPGVTEMFEALNEFIECMENLEENLGNALDNAFENVVEGCIEAIAEAIVDGLCYEPLNFWEIRELVSQQLKLIDSSTDWATSKHCFVDGYISDSMSFNFKNTAGNLMYLCAMEFWIENQNYIEPDYRDPHTWGHPFCGDTWSCYADYALYYNLEKPNNYWNCIAGVPEFIFSENYRIGIDFNNNEYMDYALNNKVIAQIFRSHAFNALSNVDTQTRSNFARGYPTSSADITYMVEETFIGMMNDGIEDYNEFVDEMGDIASNIANTITSSPLDGVSDTQYWMGFCCEVCCQTVNAPNCPCGARELVYKYQEAKYGYSSKDIQDEENKAVRKMLGEVLSSGYDRLVESLGKVVDVTQFGSFSDLTVNNDGGDDGGDDGWDDNDDGWDGPDYDDGGNYGDIDW